MKRAGFCNANAKDRESNNLIILPKSRTSECKCNKKSATVLTPGSNIHAKKKQKMKRLTTKITVDHGNDRYQDVIQSKWISKAVKLDS